MDLKTLLHGLTKTGDNQIKDAIKCLKSGGVIAYPTEAVFGLGCDPFNIDAVSRILKMKSRPMEKGFILIASDWKHVEPLVETIEPMLMSRVRATWPGPTTWVFPSKPETPQWIRGKYNTLAIRITNHPVARQLCEQFGGAIISTSANRSSAPPARDARTVQFTFGDEVDYVIKGEVGKRLQPTEIRDAITGETLRK